MNLFRTDEKKNRKEDKKMIELDKLMTADQAAEMLAISTTTFNKLVKAGKIKYVAVGRRARRYSQDAIIEFRKRETKCML